MSSIGQFLNSVLGTQADLDDDAVHARILDFEKRSLWIEAELNDKENQSLETCRHSAEMLESLQDEKNLLELLTNVMYRREKLLKQCK